MDKKWVIIFLSILLFVVGFLILFEQYLSYGVWFQRKDVHHETFALLSFALAIGILIGLNACKK
jgi:preprotein translocase subunit SecE